MSVPTGGGHSRGSGAHITGMMCPRRGRAAASGRDSRVRREKAHHSLPHHSLLRYGADSSAMST